MENLKLLATQCLKELRPLLFIKASNNREARDCNYVEIPADVTTIGIEAFFMNYKIKYIMMPNTIKTIQNDAFNEVIHLRGISLSQSLTCIGERAFNECISLYP
jgi:hypothetical protein